MAAFKFDFTVEEEPDCGSFSDERHFVNSSDSGPPDSISVQCAQEVSVQPFHTGLVKAVTSSSYTVPGTELRYISAADLHKFLASHTQTLEPKSATVPAAFKVNLQSLLSLTESQNSDLISGVYEGGFKIWECAFDLVEYLAESGIQLSGMRVLELGCGAGLPGLFALKNGAECVHFQDYNPEVIQFITIPNVLLNENESTQIGNGTAQIGNESTQIGNGTAQIGTVDCSLISKCRFYSGDWADLSPLLTDQSDARRYDVILTSETIYSIASQPKLLSALKQLINPTNGIVFVAAKSYYFGVGGSVEMFQDLVQRDGSFELSTCRKIDDSVPRIILKLKPIKL